MLKVSQKINMLLAKFLQDAHAEYLVLKFLVVFSLTWARNYRYVVIIFIKVYVFLQKFYKENAIKMYI